MLWSLEVCLPFFKAHPPRCGVSPCRWYLNPRPTALPGLRQPPQSRHSLPASPHRLITDARDFSNKRPVRPQPPLMLGGSDLTKYVISHQHHPLLGRDCMRSRAEKTAATYRLQQDWAVRGEKQRRWSPEGAFHKISRRESCCTSRRRQRRRLLELSGPQVASDVESGSPAVRETFPLDRMKATTTGVACSAQEQRHGVAGWSTSLLALSLPTVRTRRLQGRTRIS